MKLWFDEDNGFIKADGKVNAAAEIAQNKCRYGYASYW
jgi:hypothetical protein